MSKERIALAMSGGVDSTVAAYLALQQGYDVTGIHLRLDDSPADEALQQSCEALGIKLIECDCRRAFHEKVIIPAAEVYVSGRTPNPCCECNKILKFAELFRAAGDHGMDKVWTGHYVTCVQDTDGRYMLRRGSDNCKDQSYFLYRLTQAELSRVGFPLGSLSKAEVRQIATAAGLPCASRPDSQDACFQIPGECCGETLRRRSGITVPPGITKKNSQQILINRNTGRPFVAPSKKYKEYERQALRFIPKVAKPVDYGVHVQCRFYMPTRRKCDLTNLLEAVDDIMVKAGLLADDDYTIIQSHDFSRVFYDKENPRTEVFITKEEHHEAAEQC